MPPVLDAVGPSSSGFSSAATPYTWTHAVAVDATLLVVGLSCGTDGRTLTVTAGGVPMTTNAASTAWKRHTNDGTAGFGQWYALPAPPTGTVTIAISGATTGDRITAGSLSFQGTALDASAYGTPVSAAGTSGTPALNISTVASGNLVAGFLAAGSSGGVVGGTGTSRWVAVGDTSSGAGNQSGLTAPATGATVALSRAMASDFWAFHAVEVLGAGPAAPPLPPRPQPGGQTWRRRYRRRQVPGRNLFVPPPDFTEAGAGADALNIPQPRALTDAGAGAEALSLGPPFIAGLAGGGTGYFTDQNGAPRLVWGDAAWGLTGNVGRWSSGAWQTDYDTYFATRAGQGFTVIYAKPMGSAQSGNIDNNGGQYDGTMPFQGGAGANPSTGLTATYWARIDYMFAKAASLGITIFMNAIGYDSDFNGGPGPLAGKTATEFQAYGAALGARYAATGNLIWVVADDYFGSADTKISSFLTGLRGAGDTHPVTIENMAESTSRKTLDTSPGTLAWGTANAQYNWVYSYNVIYRGIEQAYAESSPIPVLAGDGYFYQGSTTYAGGTSFAFDRCFRQEAWWALSSGARGKVHGDESVWQFQSVALAAAANHWWHANESANIVAAFTALTGWHLLLPDTGSVLVTAGRGTRASAFVSGGGGGQYEPANTDAYVTASVTATGSLAVIYLSHGTTITIDESQVGGAGNYTARRMDPDSGTLTTLTPGTTYNSASWGNNGKGDPDWVLVLAAAGGATAIPLPEAGAGAETLTITAAVALVEAGAGAQAVTVTAPTTLAEAGAGAETLTLTQPASLTEAGAGAQTLTLTAAVALPETGAGAEALTATIPVALGEAGAGAETLTATVPVVFPEAGTAADTVGVSLVAAVALTDAGAGADTLTVVPVVVLTETGTGADTLTVAAVSAPSLPETGTGAETLALTQSSSLGDAGAASDALGTIPGLTEAGAGAETLSVSLVAAVTLAEAGAGADGFTSATPVALTETATGADTVTLAVVVALVDAGAGTDASSVGGATQVPLAEAGSGAETVTATTATTLTEAGAGAESLATSQVSAVPLAEAGAGAETFTLTSASPVALTEAGAGADALAITSVAALAEAGTAAAALTLAGLLATGEAGAGADTLSVGGVFTIALTEAGTGAAALAVPLTRALLEAGAGADGLVAAPFTSAALGGIAPGGPHGRWAAGTSGNRYSANSPHGRWSAGEPHA